MYDTILVPTDGSEKSTVALEHAIDLASTYDATLHAQYVVESSPAFSAELDETTEEEIYGSLFDAGRRAVDEVAARADDDGVPEVETVVDRGRPHEEILGYADDADVDLVVMATAGRTGESRELIGSVAERVVRSSPVPVLTVAADDE
ncbi:universal stress protein [Natrarchaeobius chitinivorans]|uniref:Universal stress protein n=1 Tax=Natrarchaeobius chitinivorans TaxID=1679083 RepID=A0A3N6MCF6_NATCH|nr:universal stress protein [Natrarchaeobius chitinivorans]RQG94210.1 universal stress protein [Natrarchaeobius chitinivorans]